MPTTNSTTNTFYQRFEDLTKRYAELKTMEEACSDLFSHADTQLHGSPDTKNAKINATTIETINSVLTPANKIPEENKNETISVTTMLKTDDTLSSKTAETLPIEILMQSANELKKGTLELDKDVQSAANEIEEKDIATSMIADFFPNTSKPSQASDQSQASTPSAAPAAEQAEQTDQTNKQNNPEKDIKALIEDAASLIADIANHKTSLQKIAIADAVPNPIKRALWTYGLSTLVWYPARVVGSAWTFVKEGSIAGATAVADNASHYPNDRFRHQAEQKNIWNHTVIRPVPSAQLVDEPTAPAKDEAEAKGKPDQANDPKAKGKPDQANDPEAKGKPATANDPEAKGKPATANDPEAKEKPATANDPEAKEKPEQAKAKGRQSLAKNSEETGDKPAPALAGLGVK